MATEDQAVLLNAIEKNDFKTVKTSLHIHPELANCTVQPKGKPVATTPLIVACDKGEIRMVKILLKFKADTSCTGNVTEPPWSYTGYTEDWSAWDNIFPLFVAVEKLKVSIVEELLHAGASVNQANAIGQTALHNCAMFGFGTVTYKIIQILLENGADINLQDHMGRTPLHYACKNSTIEFVKILVENGANLTMKDNEGFSALEMMAHCISYENLKTMLKIYPFTMQETVEAHETIALMLEEQDDQYESMRIATLLRIENNLPKTVLRPLECYGFTKEWETLQELEACENDRQQLSLQAMLARERIFHGRNINVSQLVLALLRNALGNQMVQKSKLLQHLLGLLRGNKGYLHFPSKFLLFEAHLEDLETDAVTELVKEAMRSCVEILEQLGMENRYWSAEQLRRKVSKVLKMAATFLFRLLKRDRKLENTSERVLAEKLLSELLEKFPKVRNPATGDKDPLLHTLVSTKLEFSLNEEYMSLSEKQRLFVCHSVYIFNLLLFLLGQKFNIDFNSLDSEGNTLIHSVFISILECTKFYNYTDDLIIAAEKLVNLLLEHGVYLHARNKMRQTARDLYETFKPYAKEDFRHILEIMQKFDEFPSLKHITATRIKELNMQYHTALPQSLSKFVDFH